MKYITAILLTIFLVVSNLVGTTLLIEWQKYYHIPNEYMRGTQTILLLVSGILIMLCILFWIRAIFNKSLTEIF